MLARTTSLVLAEAGKDPLGVAADMGVTHLVGGSIRREGEQARIAVHLVDVSSGKQLWSEVYDKSLTHLLMLQDDIARTVCRKIFPRLTGNQSKPEAVSAAPDSAAFREFSKGRYFWKRDNLNPQRALERYQAALQIDPNFAAPLAGIVECLNTLAVFHVAPQQPARDDAIRYAERALFLSPDDPETLFAFGYMQYYMRWDWQTAELALERCLTINPNHPLAHGFLALLNATLRREELSRSHALTQTRIDPFSTVGWLHLALHYRYFQRYRRSLDAAREGLELRANDVVLRWIEIDSLIRLGEGGQMADAVQQLETATAEHYPMFHALVGLQHRMLDDDQGFQRVQGHLAQYLAERWDDPFVESILAVGRNDADAALSALESAYENRDAALWLINCDPTYEPLEGQTRLAGLRQRMNLPNRF